MLDDLHETAAVYAAWQAVPAQAARLAQELTKLAADVRQAISGLPLDQLDAIWYAPHTKMAMVIMQDGASCTGWVYPLMAAVPAVYLSKQASFPEEELWVPVARGTGLPDQEKQAAVYCAVHEMLDDCGLLHKAASDNYSHAIRGLGEAAGYLPGGQLSWQIPGVPRHLTGMLGGGLIGAGLGGGLGYLASKALPASWHRNRLARTGAMMGGAIGMAPGATTLAFNALSGRKLTDDALTQMPPPDTERYRPSITKQVPGPANNSMPVQPGHAAQPHYDTREIEVPNPEYDPHMPFVLPSEYAKIMGKDGIDTTHINPSVKAAFESQSGYEIMPLEIPLEELHKNIWYDPRVAGRLPIPMRAAVTGLAETAYQASGNEQRFITPVDLARITAGMGAGYLSGAVIGKALGALLGAPDAVQDKLKNIGLWAGVVQQVVPLAFPGR